MAVDKHQLTFFAILRGKNIGNSMGLRRHLLKYM